MAKNGFRHAITLFCTNDLEASDTFYGGLLGLERVMKTRDSLNYRLSDTAYFGLTARPGREPKAGAALIEFTVATDAEVDAWHAKITAAGHAVDGPPRDTGHVYCFFATDPNGYIVEVFRPYEPSAMGLTDQAGNN